MPKSMRMLILSGAAGLLVTAGAQALAAHAPRGAHRAPPYYAYVTNEISGDLSIIDGRTLRVVATVPLGRRPRGIEASPDGRYLYIALSGSPIMGPPGSHHGPRPPPDKAADGIAVFNAATRSVVRVIRGVSDPEKLAVSPDGKRLYVASEDAGRAVVMDIATGRTLASVPVGAEPEGVRVSPNGRFVYFTSESANAVYVMSTRTDALVTTFKVGANPRAVAFSPSGRMAYVPGEADASVTIVNAVKMAPVKTFYLKPSAIFRPLVGVARPMDSLVSRNGRWLYVSTGRAGAVVSVNLRTDRIAHVAMTGIRPWSLALTPNGRRLFAANGPSNNVSVIDAANFKVIATIPCGTGPWGVAVARARRR
ncbi:MAG: beta-propeller fold lactonase family protein [Steroidobacteraceae bacterium]